MYVSLYLNLGTSWQWFFLIYIQEKKYINITGQTAWKLRFLLNLTLKAYMETFFISNHLDTGYILTKYRKNYLTKLLKHTNPKPLQEDK